MLWGSGAHRAPQGLSQLKAQGWLCTRDSQWGVIIHTGQPLCCPVSQRSRPRAQSPQPLTCDASSWSAARHVEAHTQHGPVGEGVQSTCRHQILPETVCDVRAPRPRGRMLS